MANREIISFTFDPTTIDALKTAAKADERSASFYAERAVKAYLAMSAVGTQR